MKAVSVRELQKKVKECVDQAQADRVVITRHGRPAAVLVGVEGADWETVVLQTDPRFWKLIRARRRQPTVSLEQLNRRLGTRRGAAIRRAETSRDRPARRNARAQSFSSIAQDLIGRAEGPAELSTGVRKRLLEALHAKRRRAR